MNPIAAANLSDNAKQEQKYMLLTKKIDKLTRIVESQHEMIQSLRDNLWKVGVKIPKVKNFDDSDDSSHDFSSENSNSTNFKKRIKNGNQMKHLPSTKSVRSQFSTVRFLRNNEI